MQVPDSVIFLSFTLYSVQIMTIVFSFLFLQRALYRALIFLKTKKTPLTASANRPWDSKYQIRWALLKAGMIWEVMHNLKAVLFCRCEKRQCSKDADMLIGFFSWKGWKWKSNRNESHLVSQQASLSEGASKCLPT